MPLGRRSLDAKDENTKRKKSPMKTFNLGKNIEDIQKFFISLKMAKPKVDTRWPEHKNPLRSKAKPSKATDTLQIPKSMAEIEPLKRTQSLTVGSAKEAKAKLDQKQERRSLGPLETVPTPSPTIIVTDENYNKKSQIDFSQLFDRLTEYLNSDADDAKKQEIVTTCKSMQDKINLMETIVEDLQAKAVTVCDILNIDIPRRTKNGKQE